MPMGRPAIIDTADNNREYGSYKGYVYCGAHGFQKLVEDAATMENALTLKKWFRRDKATENLSRQISELTALYAESSGDLHIRRHRTMFVQV